MRLRFRAFAFSVVFGLVLCVGLIYVLAYVPVLASNTLFGLSWNSIVAILVAVPAADFARRRLFSWNSFGERP